MLFKMNPMGKIALISVVLLSFGLIQSGCETMTRAQKGVLIGGAGGAAAGGLIGGKKNAGQGAIIGGAVGALSGGLIGNYMDKQARELASVAEVKRTEDGITVTMRDKILFDTGQSALKSGSKDSLTKIAEVLNKYDKTEVTIIGHTDNVGSATYNQSLSQRRANAVQLFLVGRKVHTSRMKPMGMGFDQPVSSNATPEGKAENRRVELHITPDVTLMRDAEASSGRPGP